MAKLFEYQGKQILKAAGVPIPKGFVVNTPEEAEEKAKEIGKSVVVKAQAWVTGRAGKGGIAFCDTPEEAAEAAQKMLSLSFNNFKVRQVLVEEKLSIETEAFAGIIIDDSAKQPMLIVSSRGGSGIEEIAEEHPESVIRTHININDPLQAHRMRNLLRKVGITGKDQMRFADLISKLWKAAKSAEARSLEVNPIVKTSDGKWLAADCHATVDDYAVFRHPELGIEIAREFNRPPTELEKIAYEVEEGDYRGTFYFIQLELDYKKGDGVIGFHGSGGGGSMMSMDALLNKGFKLANFCDTSGNPSASKVYRAAKIILGQGPVDGYFLSGSGVASQEQFHSARGLIKAFRELWLDVPAVIRLGGNGEDKAVEFLKKGCADLPAPVEGYKKHDTPEFCAERMRKLMEEKITSSAKPEAEPFNESYSFDSPTGKVSFDYDKMDDNGAQMIVDLCKPGILALENGRPVLSVTREEAAKNKCIECLACEVESQFAGYDAVRISLPTPGLDDAVNKEEA
jgi:succinyl-CoA synthetase beta subunit